MTYFLTSYSMQEPCFLIWTAWMTFRRSVTFAILQTG